MPVILVEVAAVFLPVSLTEIGVASVPDSLIDVGVASLPVSLTEIGVHIEVWSFYLLIPMEKTNGFCTCQSC